MLPFFPLALRQKNSSATELPAPTLVGYAGDDEVWLEWTDSAAPGGYELQLSTDGGVSYTTLAIVEDLSNSATGLTPNTSYRFRVRGLGNGTTYANSPYSNVLTIKTTYFQLGTPVVSAEKGVNPGEVLFKWPAISTAHYYQVELSVNGGGYMVMESNQTENSYAYTGSAGSTVQARVYAKSDNPSYADSEYGTSAPYTIPSSTTTLPAPTITISNIGSISLQVNWTDIANESGMELQQSLTNVAADFKTTNNKPADSTYVIRGGLAPATKYYFRARRKGDGLTYLNSNWSAVVSATTLP